MPASPPPCPGLQFVRDEDGSLTELGHGTFSVVYLARLLPAGKHVAAKVTPPCTIKRRFVF